MWRRYLKRVMNYLPHQHTLTIALPTALKKGELVCRHLTQKYQDFKVSLARVPNSLVRLTTEHMASGRWLVQVFWTDGNREYFLEEELMIRG